MLYININKEVCFSDIVYGIQYIDYPRFSFVKRISKKIDMKEYFLEEGIDFSNDIFFYSVKYDKFGNAYDMKIEKEDNFFCNAKRLIDEFKVNNLKEELKSNVDSLKEKNIIDRFFLELEEKL